MNTESTMRDDSMGSEPYWLIDWYNWITIPDNKIVLEIDPKTGAES